MTADEIIQKLEKHELGWSLDHTGHMIEARVWDWPAVIGRYRPDTVEPLAHMLEQACVQAGIWDRMNNLVPHNPDNLTPEIIGVEEGYRLLDRDEIKEATSIRGIDMWDMGVWWKACAGSSLEYTYRTKLTREQLAEMREFEK